MVFTALLVGGFAKKEIAESKQAKEEAQNKAPIREVSRDELEYRAKIWYLKGETEPFTGTSIHYRKDGSKWVETPYVDGKEHGTEIHYYEDGSKEYEIPWVDGKKHGAEIWYRQDGSKLKETPFVEGKIHGTQIRYFKDGSTITSEWVHGTGTEILYYPDGRKWEEVVYENGIEISRKYF